MQTLKIKIYKVAGSKYEVYVQDELKLSGMNSDNITKYLENRGVVSTKGVIKRLHKFGVCELEVMALEETEED